MFSLWRLFGLVKAKPKPTPVIPLPNMLFLTGNILNKITPSIKGKYADDIAEALNEILPLYKMNTADIFHEFWANVLEESWEMGRFTESMNYRYETLLKTFGRHRISEADARKYGRTADHPANQVALANILYGGAWGKKNLGNVLPNDGWDMRGSGALQVTGRGNMTKLTDFLNKLLGTNYTPKQVAELIRTDLKMAIHSACWVFAVAKNLIKAAIDDMMLEIVKKINGGTTNLSKRLAYYDNVKKYVV